MFTESVNVRNEVVSDRDIGGAVEERFNGGAKTVVALDDFLDCIVVETHQIPKIADWIRS